MAAVAARAALATAVSTAATPASEATPSAAAEATPSASEVHEAPQLDHHVVGGIHAATAAEAAASAAHARLVLPLGDDGQLATLEERLIQVTRLDRALLRSELNESLPLGLLRVVVFQNGDTSNLATHLEVLDQRLLVSAEVDVLDEHTALVLLVRVLLAS